MVVVVVVGLWWGWGPSAIEKVNLRKSLMKIWEVAQLLPGRASGDKVHDRGKHPLDWWAKKWYLGWLHDNDDGNDDDYDDGGGC